MSLQIWMMLVDEPLKPPIQQPTGLAAVPLFHTTGCHAVFLSAFRSQTKLVLIRK